MSESSGGLVAAIASILLLLNASISLHARLYDLRPPAEQLTAFYLAMSVGGALGGLFAALIAPALFDWAWEHPVLVLAAALLMPLPSLLKWHRMDGLDPQMRRLAAFVFVLAGRIHSLDAPYGC